MSRLVLVVPLVAKNPVRVTRFWIMSHLLHQVHLFCILLRLASPVLHLQAQALHPPTLPHQLTRWQGKSSKQISLFHLHPLPDNQTQVSIYLHFHHNITHYFLFYLLFFPFFFLTIQKKTALSATISSLLPEVRQSHFSHQSLVTFCDKNPFDRDGRYQSLIINSTCSFNNVKSIISIERSLHGQIYLLQDLDKNGHCSLKTHDVFKHLSSKTYSTKKEYPTRTVPVLHVPSSCNFISSNKEIVVINSDDSTHNLRINGCTNKRPISLCKKLMNEMFVNGIESFFRFDKKKKVLHRVYTFAERSKYLQGQSCWYVLQTPTFKRYCCSCRCFAHYNFGLVHC